MSRRRDILRVLEEDQWGHYLMMQVIFLSYRRERRSMWQYERQWNKLPEKLCHQGKFHADETEYRVT